MNWVTTNIRFPEDLYMELKMEAARTRKSVAAIIRERVAKKEKPSEKKHIDKMMSDLETFAKQMKRYTKGKSLSKALIEMRYEQ